MPDENPYASPQHGIEQPAARPRGPRAQPAPMLSWLLMLGLVLDMVMIPVGLLIAILDRRLFGFSEGASFILVATTVYAWFTFGWPLTTITAFVYTQTFDRRTPRWITKSFVAAGMFLFWLMIYGPSIAIAYLAPENPIK